MFHSNVRQFTLWYSKRGLGIIVTFQPMGIFLGRESKTVTFVRLFNFLLVLAPSLVQ